MPITTWKQTHTDEKWLEKLKSRFKESYIAEVGFPSKAAGVTYPSVRKEYDDGSPPPRVIDVAVQNEFGVGVPARPFMKLSKPGIQNVLKTDILKQLRLVNKGTIRPVQLVERIAPKAADVIKRTIVQISDPPNSPRTVAIKKSSNPLIDTGLMRQTVTWEVLEGSVDKSGGA